MSDKDARRRSYGADSSNYFALHELALRSERALLTQSGVVVREVADQQFDVRAVESLSAWELFLFRGTVPSLSVFHFSLFPWEEAHQILRKMDQRGIHRLCVVARSHREASTVFRATLFDPSVSIILAPIEPTGTLVAAFALGTARNSPYAMTFRTTRHRWGRTADRVSEIVFSSGFCVSSTTEIANRLALHRSTLGEHLASEGIKSPRALVAGLRAAHCVLSFRSSGASLRELAVQVALIDPASVTRLLRTVTGRCLSDIGRSDAFSTASILDDVLPVIGRFVRN